MNLTPTVLAGRIRSMRLLLALQEFWPVLYALPNFRTAHMDLLINTFGTPYGQETRRARCPTYEPHFKRRFMINQAR